MVFLFSVTFWQECACVHVRVYVCVCVCVCWAVVGDSCGGSAAGDREREQV